LKARINTPHAMFLIQVPSPLNYDMPTHIKRFLTSGSVLSWWNNETGYHSRAGKKPLEMFNRHVTEEIVVTDPDAVKRLVTMATAVIPVEEAPTTNGVELEFKHATCCGCKAKVPIERCGKNTQWQVTNKCDQKVGRKFLCQACAIRNIVGEEKVEVSNGLATPTIATKSVIKRYWNYHVTQTIC